MSDLVLWGHDLDDYKEMFDLKDADLASKILEFGSGPSAFNANMHALNFSCVSCDPLFALDIDTLKSKAVLVFSDRVAQIKKDPTLFEFNQYEGLDGLIAKRQAGMNQFFMDYVNGKEEGRYLPALDMSLPFADFTFDLVLSSHYFFTGIDNQDLDFHINMIKELARVAKEVRLFPLIDRYGQTSTLLGPVLLALQQDNYGVEVKSIIYHLQQKGNAMLRVWAQECRL